MSRCFPYPPPGYERNGIRDEALMESIKLRREGEKKAKKDRKKEKKREDKEKGKARKDGDVESIKRGHKKRHREERRREEEKGGECHNVGQNESEQLEKSSLTEEHGCPVGSQNSSDSSLDSNKRLKHGLTPDDRLNSGSIIRIRLPFQRHKDPEMLPSKEQPCSVLEGTDDASVKGIHEPCPPVLLDCERKEHLCLTSSSKDHESSLRLGKEKPSTSSGACENVSHHTNSAAPSNLCGSCSPSLALKFRDLVEDWVPSLIQNEQAGYGNQEWLLEAKQNEKQISEAKLRDLGSIGLSCANSTAWPCSFYLPEADIYALPFTVPF